MDYVIIYPYCKLFNNCYWWKETVVERLVHWTPDQEVPGSNPAGGLNFRVSESALSTAP